MFVAHPNLIFGDDHVDWKVMVIRWKFALFKKKACRNTCHGEAIVIIFLEEPVVKSAPVAESNTSAIGSETRSQNEPGNVGFRGKKAFENRFRRNRQSALVLRPRLRLVAQLEPVHLLVLSNSRQPPLGFVHTRCAAIGLL